MANLREVKRCIALILSELDIKRQPVTAKYRGQRVDAEEWGRNRYFLFKQLDNKSFELKASKILDVCFNFKKVEVHVVRDHDKCLLIANEDVIIYRVGERKLYCYRHDTDSIYRIDKLFGREVFLITQSATKPKLKPEREAVFCNNKPVKATKTKSKA